VKGVPTERRLEINDGVRKAESPVGRAVCYKRRKGDETFRSIVRE
jgi:hypothetical protein